MQAIRFDFVAEFPRTITKAEIGLFGVEVTVDDSKARRELGYLGTMTRERGLAAMTAAGPIAAR